jgi:hypothetical protein
MKTIYDSRIVVTDNKYIATCHCGKKSLFNTKHGAHKMLSRNRCRFCCKTYQTAKHTQGFPNIYRRADKKWCSTCSGCGKEQAYTRLGHARQSERADWQCKKCVGGGRKHNKDKDTERQRIFEKYRLCAGSRNILWAVTFDDVFELYTGKCALTNWPLNLSFSNATASLDRIDSGKGYTRENIQWVHKMVNMCKNKYMQQDFISMCHAVAQTCTTSLV